MRQNNVKHRLLIAVLALLLVILSACDIPELTTQTNRTTIETTGKWSNPQVRIVEVEVTKVSDGDTIRATVDGKNQRIRLIGINSPEIAHPDDGIEAEYFGQEAFAYTKEMLEGKRVYLSFDEAMHDQYGRILAYVWLESPKGNEEDYAFAEKHQFNCLLLKNGYAKFVRIPPNLTFAKIHKELANSAREAKIGLWSDP